MQSRDGILKVAKDILSPLAPLSGIIVAAAVAKTNGSFPFPSESQTATTQDKNYRQSPYLFPGDHMPSGTQKCVVIEFHFSVSILLCSQYLFHYYTLKHKSDLLPV